MQSLVRWWNSRVPITGEQLRTLTNEPVPNHLKHWWFCLGGTPAYLFVIQIVTGILLAFYYQPAAATVHDSVDYITNQATLGWYFRSMHKWAATFMIAAVILHQTRVYFTGAYRAPRELNWVVGMLLLLCTLGLGFTGYSLVFEQLSYWGATVGANLCDQIPVVGGIAKKLLLGGEVYSDRTLPRFYVLHAAILPGALLALLGVHITLIRLHGITEMKFKSEPKESSGFFNFFPDHLYTELIIGMLLMVVLTVLATVLPAHMGPKADPLTTPDVIKPEWFFFATFRWLKLFPLDLGVFTIPAIFAIIGMGLAVFAMIAWPWIDAILRRVFKWEQISVWIGVAVASTIIILTILEGVLRH